MATVRSAKASSRPDVPSIIEFVTDPQLLDLSVSPAQATCLKVLYGLPLTVDEQAIARACTGDRPLVADRRGFGEATVVAGARSGKDSRIACPIAAYEAIFGDHARHLARGERGVIPLVAQGQRGTRVAFGYISDYLHHSPLLRSRIAEPLAHAITLTNKMTIRMFPCTVRSLRAWSIPAAVLDEVAFWRLEGAVEADQEVLRSIRRGTVNFPASRIVKVSTPYMRSGILYEDFKRSFGVDDPDLLVWRAPTRLMHPTIPQAKLDRERRLDPQAFAREYEAEFIEDIDAFIPSAWVEAAVVPHRFALPPQLDRHWYSVAIDASGGGADAFTASAVHLDGDGATARAVQDYLKGWRRSRSTSVDLEGIVAEIVTVARAYGVDSILADRYAAGWVVQAFARHGVTVVPAPDKATAYQDLEPLLAQGRVDLLDHPQQARELTLLERRARPGGKPAIDHPRGGRDDHSNALALAVYGAVQAAAAAVDVAMSPDEQFQLQRWLADPSPSGWAVPAAEFGGRLFTP